MKCGLCGHGGASKNVKDAAGTPHVVHRACWLSVQQMAGNLLRSDLVTPEGRKTARTPTADEANR